MVRHDDEIGQFIPNLIELVQAVSDDASKFALLKNLLASVVFPRQKSEPERNSRP